MLRDARSYWKHDYESEFPSIIQSVFYLSNIRTRGVCRQLPKSLTELQRGAARPQAEHETAAGEAVCVDAFETLCRDACVSPWGWPTLYKRSQTVTDCAAELLTPLGTQGCGGSTDSDSIRVMDPCELCLDAVTSLLDIYTPLWTWKSTKCKWSMRGPTRKAPYKYLCVMNERRSRKSLHRAGDDCRERPTDATLFLLLGCRRRYLRSSSVSRRCSAGALRGRPQSLVHEPRCTPE